MESELDPAAFPCHMPAMNKPISAAEIGAKASPLAAEVQRRRTFAIISHPDAGKTTLTEKLLLFGGLPLEQGVGRALCSPHRERQTSQRRSDCLRQKAADLRQYRRPARYAMDRTTRRCLMVATGSSRSSQTTHEE